MSMKELLTKFVTAIDAEIAIVEKETRDQAYELLSGQKEEKSTGTLYVFVLADALRLPEDATGTLKVDGRDIKAMVVSVEGNRIWLLLESSDPLPDYIASARLVVNETDLLKCLKEKIETLRSGSDLGLATKVFGFEAARIGSAEFVIQPMNGPEKQSNMSVQKVIQQCCGSEVTFIWGPPGTGKTFTIAALVARLTELDQTVLVTSHTHAAVEQALMALVEPPDPDRNRSGGFLYGSPLIEKGRILKVGQVKDLNIPPKVHLESYLEALAEERERNVTALTEECELVLRRLQQVKTELAPWLELKKAESAYQNAQERHETALAARDATANAVVKAHVVLDQSEAARAKAEHSFFIGRRGRVQKASYALAKARQAMALAQATAGQAEASAILAQRTMGEAHARLLRVSEVTRGLRPSEELEREFAAAQARKATLESEIAAIQGSVDDDAKHLVQNALAIFATLTKLYVDRNLLPELKWDIVVVDEVSMAMPPLLAIAASRARKCVVLVGDMYQLPPVVHSRKGDPGDILGQDIFELRKITEAIDSGGDHPQLAKLTIQRRMHPEVAAVAKSLIEPYHDLTDQYDAKTRQDFVSAIGTDSALVVIDTNDLMPWSGKMPGSLSRFNFMSGQAAVELSSLYATQCQEPAVGETPHIGIITPYAAQRRYLNKLVQTFGLERWVTAGTVHTFQGNERDVVIFDSVLGEPHWTSRFTNPQNWDEVRRDLNVAVTRARHQFVFIADTRWLSKHARANTGYGKLWAFLERHAKTLNASDILGPGFKARVAKTVSGVKGWDIKNTGQSDKLVLLTEADFYEHFTSDLLAAESRVVLYTPFIGKTRWPLVVPYIAMLREHDVEVFLLHKPLSDPEWRQGDREFGKSVLDSLSRLGVKLIPLSGVHAKTIVIDSEIVYEGSLNWASQTSSYEHMWRFSRSDMAKLIEKMLGLDSIAKAFGEEKAGDRCPRCGGPLILINQARQTGTDPHPLKLGCARWNEDKTSCTGYLRRVDGRAPFLEPPRCSRGTKMSINHTKDGRPWDWRCGHKGCRPIRWANGDCVG